MTSLCVCPPDRRPFTSHHRWCVLLLRACPGRCCGYSVCEPVDVRHTGSGGDCCRLRRCPGTGGCSFEPKRTCACQSQPRPGGGGVGTSSPLGRAARNRRADRTHTRALLGPVTILVPGEPHAGLARCVHSPGAYHDVRSRARGVSSASRRRSGLGTPSHGRFCCLCQGGALPHREPIA